MPTVRTGPVIGLIVQIVLLAGLAGTVGLGAAGWLAGLAYAALGCAVLSRGLTPAAGLGPADRVTLARAVLVGGVTAFVADAAGRPTPVGLLVGLTAVALLLDAVDGRVARRTGTASAFGARFDMEVDAFLILVLSLYVAPSAGGWVLAIGGMRYAFVAAARVLPWMRRPLPARYWRKVVAALQGVLLLVAASGALPRSLTVVVLAVALALLVESFGHDVGWLWRHRPVRPVEPRRVGVGGARPALPAGRAAPPAGRRPGGEPAGGRDRPVAPPVLSLR